MAFPKPSITKLTKAQQHSVLITYRNLDPNRATTVENANKSSLAP